MAKDQNTLAIGRRKSSNARVALNPSSGDEAKFVVNKRTMEEYFPRPVLQQVIRQPLELTETLGKYDIRVNVRGGGISGQAGAVLLGISRALEKINPDFRPDLKKAGFLTRDDRIVERKKPGRHKARKKPQFSKR